MGLQAGCHTKFVGKLFAAESVRIAVACSILRCVACTELIVLRPPGGGDENEGKGEANAADHDLFLVEATRLYALAHHQSVE
jgi:hypothetical protein